MIWLIFKLSFWMFTFSIVEALKGFVPTLSIKKSALMNWTLAAPTLIQRPYNNRKD